MATRRPGDGDSNVADVIPKQKSEKALKEPPLYKVLLHNDNFTTMEFVVAVLESVFGLSTTDATAIMLHVHRRGVGVAGVYSLDIAETKAKKVADLAREAQFPLLCTVEPE